VGAIGLIIVAAGIGIAVKGLTASLEKDLEVQGQLRRWVVPLGRLGFMARGLVFAIVGVFLVNASVDADPNEARGLGGALRALQGSPPAGCSSGSPRLGYSPSGSFNWLSPIIGASSPLRSSGYFTNGEGPELV
jgi:Domain of Unknown Function (DUF1206)